MIKLNINMGERSYPIYIAADYSGLSKCIASAKLNEKLAVITDSNVEMYQAEECLSKLQPADNEIYKYVLKPGEQNKNLDAVKGIYSFLSSNKFDRNSAIIALGGGVTGDIAGFAAATYLRGIRFVQVPTTLLAQADSSVGGKVGVDFEGMKNIVGAFYQPSLVYVNVNTLRTLPVREIRAGLAEVIKHGLIMDADFFNYIDCNMHKIFSFDQDVLQYMTKVNCSIKGKVVEEDEKESSSRAILNFGHTYGHAIESVSNFSLLHGECVAVGMVAAYKTAQKLGMVDEEACSKVAAILEKAGLPVKVQGLDVDEVYKMMYYDKKVKGNKLTFVLPKGIGEVVQCSIDDEELIKSVLNEIIE